MTNSRDFSGYIRNLFEADFDSAYSFFSAIAKIRYYGPGTKCWHGADFEFTVEIYGGNYRISGKCKGYWREYGEVIKLDEVAI